MTNNFRKQRDIYIMIMIDLPHYPFPPFEYLEMNTFHLNNPVIGANLHVDKKIRNSTPLFIFTKVVSSSCVLSPSNTNQPIEILVKQSISMMRKCSPLLPVIVIWFPQSKDISFSCSDWRRGRCVIVIVLQARKV